ncbi:ComEC/Rec2 family competence protein [Alkaliphilus peptidifermentans]|uniref:Competence protein ComEC n=1 Tax=Alkaliphilus peptidifermentans DSM 18978 TaxID=1120976 RepID=A0A1G5BYJ1_9FIRM|nr:ComEC/Rec2 family competence protein [Alkaliphilus peptidifermentans]SCX95114.1 competence protein ComEC [Alkaliphilus peptidifermentans DSM 18978]
MKNSEMPPRIKRILLINNPLRGIVLNRPFCSLLILLILGITVGHFTELSLSIWAIAFIVIALSAIGFYLRKLNVVVMSILIITLGVVSYQLQFSNSIQMKSLLLDEYYAVAKVISAPVEKNGYWESDVVITKLINFENEIRVNEKSKARLFNNFDSNIIKPGEVITFQRYIFIEGISRNKLDGYHMYLKSRGFNYIIGLSGGNVAKYNTSNTFNILSHSNRLKETSEDILDSTLEKPQSALMKSVIFGNQGYLSAELLDYFSKSGTAHIIAVSGLHVGIIVLLLERFLSLLGVGRNSRLLLTMTVIFAYAYVVGFPVSIIRAGSMYGLFLLGYFLHRSYDSINSLAFIAFIVLVINPITLFSVSFQLSFMATLSILILYPMLNKLLWRIPTLIRKLLAVTLAAQIGTMPIMAYHFRQISIIAPLSNLLIVPILGGLLTLAFLSIFTGMISIGAAATINIFTNTLLSYMIQIVKISSNVPFSNISLQEMKIYEVLIYYLIIIAICFFIKKSKNQIESGVLEEA